MRRRAGSASSACCSSQPKALPRPLHRHLPCACEARPRRLCPRHRQPRPPLRQHRKRRPASSMCSRASGHRPPPTTIASLQLHMLILQRLIRLIRDRIIKMTLNHQQQNQQQRPIARRPHCTAAKPQTICTPSPLKTTRSSNAPSSTMTPATTMSSRSADAPGATNKPAL